MAKLLNPKLWYLVAIGAVALTADGVRRVIKRRQHTTGGNGTVEDQVAMAEVIETEAAAVEPKPKRARAKPAPKKVEPDVVESALNVAVEAVAATPVVEAVETFAEPAAPESRLEVDVAEADDLTRIKGIGPTYERRLVAAGYNSYAAVAGATADILREITKAPATADIDGWIEAARALSQ